MSSVTDLCNEQREPKQKARVFNRASDAIDYPWHVIRQMVLDSVGMFVRIKQRQPTVIHVTPAMEAALTVSIARLGGPRGYLRDFAAKDLFGMTPVWDAAFFYLE